MDKGKGKEPRSRNVRDRGITLSARNPKKRQVESSVDTDKTPSPPQETHLTQEEFNRYKTTYRRREVQTPIYTTSSSAMLPTPQTSRGSGSTVPIEEEEVDYSMEEEDDEREEVLSDGAPEIADLIPSYGFHVASQIWRKEERGILICHNRATNVKSWQLENEKALELVQASGLAHLPLIMYDQLDEPLLCAFVERWQPDTNTFHMPWGEMSVSLHDTDMCLGVPVSGKAVIPKCEGDSDEVARHLGLSLHMTDKMPGEFKKIVGWNACGVKQSLMKEIAERDGVRSSVIARIYLWWVLTSTLFVDRSRTHGAASLMALLRTPAEAGKYAWGAAALANLYRELGVTSRSGCKQLSGCLTLLQAWIYAYFPCFRPQLRASWTPGEPHARRWYPRAARADQAEEMLYSYRRQIDCMTANHVNWMPFGYEAVHASPISAFSGVIHYRSITETYMPDRFARQFGYSQGIPETPIQPKNENRVANPRDYKVEYDPATWVFEKGLQNNTFHDWQVAQVSTECADEYMGWYSPRSHPRIEHDEAPEFPSPYGVDPYQSLQSMSPRLNQYHRETYQGSYDPESEHLRQLADICNYMMPHLSINRPHPPQ